MYKLILSEEATKEFSEAAQWYEEKSGGLGEKYINIIQGKLKLIQQFPERYPKRKKYFREAVIKTFPYSIVYVFYKKEQIILILSIFHSSRNPRNKFKKK